MRLQQIGLLAALGAMGALVLGPVRAAAAETTNVDLPRSIGEVMKMKPMQVMHMIDTDKKGVVTKEQYMKFFEAIWDKMDPDHTGTVAKEAWMHGWAKRNQ